MIAPTHRNRILFLLAVMTGAIAAIIGLLNGMSVHAWLPDAPATDVGGLINSDTTWTLAGSPYVLTETLTVAAGITLTIEPGVIVMGENFSSLWVEGHLEAIGTAVLPIIFTSAANTGPGEWYGIDFVGGTGHLDHTIVRYTHQAESIIIDGSPDAEPVIIENSVIQDNLGYPIMVVTGNLHRLQLNNVSASNNMANRVWVYATDYNDNALTRDTRLTAVPGMDGYEFTQYDLKVPSGITLTLDPGVVMMGDALGALWVEGHLAAVGTAAEPIIFTSSADTGPGEWYGIDFVGGTGHLDHAIVRYTHQAESIIIDGLPDAGPVIIENSIIRDNPGYPMMVRPEDLHRLQMSNVSFAGNNKNRVIIGGDPFSNVTLTENVTLSGQPGLEGYEVVDFVISVPAGITMTLQPGTTIMATGSGYCPISVAEQGHLEAVGTAVSPATFTSTTDSGPGEWTGICVAGSAHLDQAQFRNGQLNVDIFGANGGSVLIENSIISDSGHYGMSVYADALHRLHMSNVTFNGANRRILIDRYNNSLAADSTLSKQPGLQGYEVGTLNFPIAAPNLIVPAGITLTMEAGVSLMSAENGVVTVKGHLDALGTMSDPVTFTSIADALPGEWGGLIVSGTASFDHAVIHNGQRNLDVQAGAGVVSLNNSEVGQASGEGLAVAGGQVTAVCTTFTNNTSDAIYVVGSPDVAVFSSSISGNGSGINNVGSTAVDARQNWWGDISGPGGVGPGSGDAIWGNVMYDPWLIEPTCTLTPYRLYLPVVIGP